MVLLIAPDQKGLIIVVEDTTSSGPEAAGVRCLKKTVTFLEEEVIVDQLLLHVLAHTGKRVKSALEFTGEA